MTGTIQTVYPSNVTHAKTRTAHNGNEYYEYDGEEYHRKQSIAHEKRGDMLVYGGGYERDIRFDKSGGVETLSNTDGISRLTLGMNQNSDGKGAFVVRVFRHRPEKAAEMDSLSENDPYITADVERFDSFDDAEARFYEVLPVDEYREIRIGTVRTNFDRLSSGNVVVQ